MAILKISEPASTAGVLRGVTGGETAAGSRRGDGRVGTGKL
jgi:hypothetical protein